MKTPPQSPSVMRLRVLMLENELTYANVAAYCSVSVKTVESWLASPGAENHRALHPRYLELIELKLAAEKKPPTRRK